MTTQIEDARNGVENPPPSTGEEGLVKTLVRGLVQSGGIYANARMAADQESEAQKRRYTRLPPRRQSPHSSKTSPQQTNISKR